MENWVDIKGYEGYYQVSNFGNVRSLDRETKITYNNHIRRYKGKVLTKVKNKEGYEVIILNVSDKREYKYVHHIVAETFIGYRKENEVIDHINNIKYDNRAQNLQITTIRNNTTKDIDKTKRSSKYIGVSFTKANQKWRSTIVINNKLVHLGYFDTELEAHLAYKNKVSNL